MVVRQVVWRLTGWQLDSHGVARTRICAGWLLYRLLWQSNASGLFFWFVWVGHQRERIGLKASLEIASLSLAKFIRIPNVAAQSEISQEIRPAGRIHGFL